MGIRDAGFQNASGTEVSTRDRKISIYDRYVHVDPDRENEKEN